MAGELSRRALFGGALSGAFASACGHRRGSRYQGWLFVASGEKEIAVADLASFRRVATIPLPCAADELFQTRTRVFALCRDARAIIEIDAERFRMAGRIALSGKPLAVRLFSDAGPAIVLTDEPASLVRVDLANRRATERLRLPGNPGDMDLNGSIAAVTLPAKSAIARVALSGRANADVKLAHLTDVGIPCGAIRFRRDGRTILAGATAAREIIALDAQSGKLLTRLPLPIVPSRFCFNADGGQMFITGKGADALAIVSVFQNEVDQTILAGHTPDAMAVSEPRNLLFVTNRESGDLTILDIETRSVSASVHVGENPGEVLLTPDGEYALVMDRRSGNVSVVRITTVLDRKVKTKPLFTVFPTAADARSVLIVPFRT